MGVASYANGVRFRFLAPNATTGKDGWYRLVRGDGLAARLLGLPEIPLDLANTRLPAGEAQMRERLRPLCGLPRMSTFGIGAVLNEAVSRMPEGHAFVHVGVWHGLSFLCGLAGNPDKRCVGIDDFSEFDGPRQQFLERFERDRSPRHRFFEMDFGDYFADVHREPIGVYVYDGAHSYDDQMRGLQAAEPFLAENAVVFVDDTNWWESRNATVTFTETSPFEYDVLLDRKSCGNRHPTWWNGLIVLRRTGDARRAAKPAPEPEPAEPRRPGPVSARDAWNATSPPTVTIVIDAVDAGQGNLRALIDRAASQTYSDTEVIVVHRRDSAKAVLAMGDGIVSVAVEHEAEHDPFQTGLEAVATDLVTFVQADDPLAPTSVDEGVRAACEARLHRLDLAAQDLLTAIPAEDSFILVDDEAFAPEFVLGARAIPFLERDGRYWGRPPDGATAVGELERLRNCGAGFAVFGWPAFWWLEHYPALHNHLRARFPCSLENDRVVVFDLRG